MRGWGRLCWRSPAELLLQTSPEDHPVLEGEGPWLALTLWRDLNLLHPRLWHVKALILILLVLLGEVGAGELALVRAEPWGRTYGPSRRSPSVSPGSRRSQAVLTWHDPR